MPNRKIILFNVLSILFFSSIQAAPGNATIAGTLGVTSLATMGDIHITGSHLSNSYFHGDVVVTGSTTMHGQVTLPSLSTTRSRSGAKYSCSNI